MKLNDKGPEATAPDLCHIANLIRPRRVRFSVNTTTGQRRWVAFQAVRSRLGVNCHIRQPDIELTVVVGHVRDLCPVR